MKKHNLRIFDPARYLKNERACELYLEQAMIGNDHVHIARAKDDIERARRSFETTAQKPAL